MAHHSALRRITRLLALAVALLGATAAAAQASSISYQGDTLLFAADPGRTDFVVVDGDTQHVTFTDDDTIRFPADRCHQDDPQYPVSCDIPAAAVRVDLGDGADRGSFGFSIPTNIAFTIAGGPGDDVLTGPRNGVGAATLDGGEGDDTLTSEETADTQLGGPGNDKLNGGAGADVLRGGDGDDVLRGDMTDAAYPDVMDGGAGSDLVDVYRGSDPATAPPVSITLNGIADDGRPDEHDDIVAVERFDVGAVTTFSGDDADNTFTAPEKGRAVRLSGAGGNDTLTATDAGGDVVDGGPGDDTLSGAMGDDTIVGGPGRDQLIGDRPARCNELHCDITPGFGNDTIEAVDGEVDSIQCGPGTDTVHADGSDRVADDCEHVTRSGAAGAGPTPATKPGTDPKQDRPAEPAALTVLGSRRIATALRAGLRVRVAGGRAVTVRALLGRRVVAQGRGRGTVRLRWTSAGRQRLRHARRVTLTIVAGTSRTTVVLSARPGGR